jgi:hypothetical protein
MRSLKLEPASAGWKVTIIMGVVPKKKEKKKNPPHLMAVV